MKTRNIVILLNLILVMGYINWSVAGKEEILKNGKLVFLELAPVDPRSLMQGDYMRLNYAIGRNTSLEKIPKRGFCIIKLDARPPARRIRFQKEKTPLHPGEYLINYTKKNWSINLGAESYFFEEGQARRFEPAKFGAIRISNGKSLLVGLYDKDFKLLGQ